MKMFKKFLIVLLCVSMLLCFAACGDTNEDVEPIDDTPVDTQADVSNDSDTEEKQDEPAAAGLKVTVVDDTGAAVSGVMMQICMDTCIPAVTDDNGVATFNIETTSRHKLSVLTCPEGYEYTGEAEVYLEDGMTEYTLSVTKVA